MEPPNECDREEGLSRKNLVQVLTNNEVLMALREIKGQKISHGARNLATITYEVITKTTPQT